MGLEYTDLFWIMVLFQWNLVESSGVQWIPVDSSPVPLDSTRFHQILLEWPDSDRNRGGTVKYWLWVLQDAPHRWVSWKAWELIFRRTWALRLRGTAACDTTNKILVTTVILKPTLQTRPCAWAMQPLSLSKKISTNLFWNWLLCLSRMHLLITNVHCLHGGQSQARHTMQEPYSRVISHQLHCELDITYKGCFLVSPLLLTILTTSQYQQHHHDRWWSM